MFGMIYDNKNQKVIINSFCRYNIDEISSLNVIINGAKFHCFVNKEYSFYDTHFLNKTIINHSYKDITIIDFHNNTIYYENGRRK